MLTLDRSTAVQSEQSDCFKLYRLVYILRLPLFDDKKFFLLTGQINKLDRMETDRGQ